MRRIVVGSSMGTATVACPYCGQGVEAPTTESGRVGGVRRRLKREYRLARHTCPECGHDYDVRNR
jgi:DNA-directed RNA polymerase subunit RPC12/RpoP